VATIHHLKSSISELSTDSAMKIIMAIRANRRIRKAPAEKAKPVRQKIDGLLKGLSDTQLSTLLKTMGGKS
jgi:hypothetical protein